MSIPIKDLPKLFKTISTKDSEVQSIVCRQVVPARFQWLVQQQTVLLSREECNHSGGPIILICVFNVRSVNNHTGVIGYHKFKLGQWNQNLLFALNGSVNRTVWGRRGFLFDNRRKWQQFRYRNNFPSFPRWARLLLGSHKYCRNQSSPGPYLGGEAPPGKTCWT